MEYERFLENPIVNNRLTVSKDLKVFFTRPSIYSHGLKGYFTSQSVSKAIYGLIAGPVDDLVSSVQTVLAYQTLTNGLDEVKEQAILNTPKHQTGGSNYNAYKNIVNFVEITKSILSGKFNWSVFKLSSVVSVLLGFVVAYKYNTWKGPSINFLFAAFVWIISDIFFRLNLSHPITVEWMHLTDSV
jgi:hypothetical protein